LFAEGGFVQSLNALQHFFADNLGANIRMLGKVQDHLIRSNSRSHILRLGAHEDLHELADHEVHVECRQMLCQITDDELQKI
jgi:hypothetical protein